MAPAAGKFALALHLPRGTVPVEAHNPLVLGRGRHNLAEDLCLSRQCCAIAFDGSSPVATITWLSKRAGRLRRSRDDASDGTERALAAERLTAGMQRTLQDGDIITELNGIAIDSPQATSELVQELSGSARSFNVIVRGADGEPRVIEFETPDD